MKPSIPTRLLIRSGDGTWSQTHCRDFEEVQRLWSARDDAGRDVAILCSSLNDVAPRVFDSVARQNAGRMLLSGGLKSFLPPSFETSSEPVATVEGIRLFVGLRGWEYSTAEAGMEEDASGTLDNGAQLVERQQDWPEDYVRENPIILDPFAGCATVLAGASELKPIPRRRFEVFLTYHRIGHERIGHEQADPCELARAVPAWLQERKLVSLALSVRAKNIFGKIDIITVKDLSSWRSEQLLEQSGFGIGSLRSTFQAIDEALHEGPNRTGSGFKTYEADGFLEQFRRALTRLSERERDVLTRRLGFERDNEILQQIGDDYGMTRERIRQIESKALEKSLLPTDWRETFETKMAAMLKERNHPLPLPGIESEDPWFKGISSHRRFCEILVSALFSDSIHLVEIDGVPYFASIGQNAWESLVSSTVKKLRSLPERRRGETAIRKFVEQQVPPEAREFAGLLWRILLPKCQFADLPDGNRVFTGYGNTTVTLVQTILTESDRPLHFTKILEIALEKRIGKDDKRINVHYIHQAAMTAGLLFAPGTYGLPKHLRLNYGQLAEIRGKAESVVFSRPEKQWHSYEILSELNRYISTEFANPVKSTDFAYPDKYMLDIALSGSKRLVSLGRMTWTASRRNQERIDIRREVVTILESAGHPLSAREIRNRLRSRRGINETFQIPLFAPIVPLENGLWGINDRDLSMKRERQLELIEILVRGLETKQYGIHESELHEFLELDGCHARTFALIAARDRRLKFDDGRYIFLAKWGKPRRHTIRTALLHIRKYAGEPLPFRETVKRVEALVGRKCKVSAIHGVMRHLQSQRAR